MRDNFESSLERVLVHEGGYVNHPADPGGATNKGVTQRVYDAWRRNRGLKERSVRNIAFAEMKEIYREQYWDAIRGDELPNGIDYVTFDGAINSGPAQSAKWLQRALGVTADGVIGNITLRAVEASADHDKLVADAISRRLAMLKALPTWRTFGKGWSARLSDVLKHGQKLAAGSVGPQPTYTASGAARARVEDISKPAVPVGGPVAASTAGGAVAAGIERAQAQLEPYASAAFVSDVLGYLAIAGVAIMLGGIVWGVYTSWRNKKAAAVINGAATADISSLLTSEE